MKGIQSFLGYASYYKHFIKDFSNIANLLCRLLEKVVKFDFDDVCLKPFECLKEWLMSASIIVSHDRYLPYEIMCNESGVAVGSFLGKRREKILYPLYYASKALSSTQKNK